MSGCMIRSFMSAPVPMGWFYRVDETQTVIGVTQDGQRPPSGADRT